MVQIMSVKAPVSGIVGEVKVQEGDNVSQGVLLVIQTATKVAYSNIDVSMRDCS